MFCGKNDMLRDLASFGVVGRLGHHSCTLRDLLQFLSPGFSLRIQGEKMIWYYVMEIIITARVDN